jgi:CRISPR-associated protein Cmr3
MSDLNTIFQQRDLVRLIGNRETYGGFRIIGIALGRREEKTGHVERLFPVPAHIIRAQFQDDQGKKFKAPVYLKPRRPAEGTLTNAPAQISALLYPDLGSRKTAGKSEPLNGWLTARGLYAALHGESIQENDKNLVPASSIYSREQRLGIGLDRKSRTSREHYLYLIEMIRMQHNYGFVIDLALGKPENGTARQPVEDAEMLTDIAPELRMPREGWMSIGGEQRAARFTLLSSEDSAGEQPFTASRSSNLLYFATPACFGNGWLPQDSKLFRESPIAAALPHYQAIGGWSLNPHDAGGKGKDMQRCIPAGSVYFFDTSITISRPVTEYGWQIGYGITYSGEWKE